MWGDVKLVTTTEGWFLDGFEFLPRPRHALIITSCCLGFAEREPT
jgi:hypothetical protein